MSDQILIKYEVFLPDKSCKVFELTLDEQTLCSKIPHTDNPPEWCRLAVHQCSHCPLNTEVHQDCPVALDLVDIVEDFGEILSFQEVQVRVTTDERKVVKKTEAQVALSSLMGLYIATSACPKTDFFKPMARFHLPFATYEETLWRAVSTYFMREYFHHKKGLSPDMDLEGLSLIYKEMQILNMALAARLKSACSKDSPINALVSLDMFAQCFPMVIEDAMEEIRYMFK